MVRFPAKKTEEKTKKALGFNASALTRFRAATVTVTVGEIDDDDKDADINSNPVNDKCYSCKCNIYETISYECKNENNKYKENGQQHIQFCEKCWRNIHELKDKKDEENLRCINFTEDEPYFFCATLTKKIYDDCNNNKNIINDMNSDSVLKLKDIKPIWISSKRIKDRVCYVQFTVNFLSIDENYETRNGECNIKMIIRIFWLFDSTDYDQYKKSIFDKNSDYIPLWKPQFTFTKGRNHEIPCDDLEFGVVPINEFFGNQILEKMLKGSKFHSLGYLNYVDYYCSLTIDEPFELSSFPFDCQDIPFEIQPINFVRFAPAFYANDQKVFIKITGDATDLGVFVSESALCEFDNNSSKVRIMIKLKRWWSPYMLKHVFLIFSATILSLSVFSLDVGDKADRLGIVLGLILTLIFIELPEIPIVTVLDKYFYSCFSFLILIAFHSGFSEAFEGTEEDSSNTITFGITYLGIFILYHIIFIIYCAIVVNRENKKINMTSDEIQEQVEGTSMNLVSYAISSDNISTSEYRQTTAMTNCDVFVACPKEEDYIGSLIASRFADNKDDSELTTSEKWFRWSNRILFLLFICIQFIVSLLLILNFNNCNISQSSTNIHEIRTIFSFSSIQLFLEMCFIYTYIWKTDMQTDFELLFLVTSGIFSFINYIIVFHQVSIWNPSYNTISCNDDNGFLQELIFALYLIIIPIPIVVFLINILRSVSKYIFNDGKTFRGLMLFFNYLYMMMQIITISLQLVELENVNTYYNDCISNKDTVFINTAESYTVLIFACVQIIGYSVATVYYDNLVDEGLNGMMLSTRCLCGGITNWGIIIHSFTFWDSNNSECFEYRNALYGLTLSWIIMEIVAFYGNLLQFRSDDEDY